MPGFARTFIVTPLAGAGYAVVFAGRALREMFRPPFEIKETARQLYEIGWRSLPLIAVSGFAVGIVLSMQTRASLERFGAELGAMKVTEQIDALEAVAVDSFKFLVVTRVVACMLAMPILTSVMNFTGIIGGWAAEMAVSGMGFGTYFRAAFSVVQFADYIPSTLKTMVFGFIIAITASYLGVHTRGGTQGVGQAATRSVVAASILLITANVVLVRLIFLMFPDNA